MFKVLLSAFKEWIQERLALCLYVMNTALFLWSQLTVVHIGSCEFSSAFDIVDHSLLLKKIYVMALYPLLYRELRITCLTKHRGCSLLEATPT